MRSVALATVATVSLSVLPLASLAGASAVGLKLTGAPFSQTLVSESNNDFCTQEWVLSTPGKFRDVGRTHRFLQEINWTSCVRIARGTAFSGQAPYFYPKQELTREAMAAFLYRLEAPKNYQVPAEPPFADVKLGDKFYREIAWMWEKKLSTGTAQPSGKPLFEPKEALSREAMAVFLFRYQVLSGDKNAVGFVEPSSVRFADIIPGSKFYREIAWMDAAKVSTGVRTGLTVEYRPKQKVTREAMAAFLYRIFKEKVGPKTGL